MEYEDSVFDSIEVIGVFADPCSSGLEDWLLEVLLDSSEDWLVNSVLVDGSFVFIFSNRLFSFFCSFDIHVVDSLCTI
jgi:hypothetical protein